MTKWGRADFEQIKNLSERLNALASADMDKFCRDCCKELAARLLALVIPATNVGHKPELEGDKTVKVTGASGKTKTFLSAEAARREQYFGGYIGGTLRRGWTAKTHEEAEQGSGRPTASDGEAYARKLPITKKSGEYMVEVINPVKYASYVEHGHRQRVGRYVPALGKRLKKPLVEGKHMLTISEEKLRSIAPAVLEKKLNAMLKEVFNG